MLLRGAPALMWLLFSGCTKLLPFAGPSDFAAADLGARDLSLAGRPDAAGDAAMPMNLLANGDFEGTRGLNEWHSDYGRVTLVHGSDAHGGLAAAELCPVSAEPLPYVALQASDITDPIAVGATYHASAWVRQTSPSQTTATIVLRQRLADNTSVESHGDTDPGDPAAGSWQYISTTLVARSNALTFDVHVGIEPQSGSSIPTTACVIIDDVVVYH